MENYIIIGLALCVVILLVYTVKSFTYRKTEKKIKPLKVNTEDKNIDFFTNKNGFIAKNTKLAVKNTGQVINMIDMGNGKVLIIEESPYFVDEMDAYVADQIINSVEVKENNVEDYSANKESSNMRAIEESVDDIEEIRRVLTKKENDSTFDDQNHFNEDYDNEYDTNDEYYVDDTDDVDPAEQTELFKNE